MINLEDTVDIHEASRLIGKSEKQVRRYITKKLLPAVLIGKQYFIKRDDIKVFIQQYVQRVPDLEVMSTQDVETLKLKVVDLEAEVISLRERIIVLESGQVTPRQTKEPKSTQRAKSAYTGTRPPLPDGWVAWGPFVGRHGADSERRPIMALRGDFCAEGEYMQMGEKSAQVVKCALDQPGQLRLLQKLWSMDILANDLKPCVVEGCACKQVFTE